ncbi:hypothetical protein V6N13_119194 [Hibiscus sabdariffa]
MVVGGDGRLRTTTFWGLLLVGIGSLLLPGFLFAAFMSKLLPPSNYPLIAAIRNDSILNLEQKSRHSVLWITNVGKVRLTSGGQWPLTLRMR